MAKMKTRAGKTPRLTKKATIVAMLEKKGGSSIAELAEAVGWNTDSVRGLISVMTSKGGLKIRSAKSGDDDRRYFIAARRRNR